MATAAALRTASVPTQTKAATPAARAATRAASVPPGRPSSSRWQWLSVQRTVSPDGVGRGRAASGAPVPRFRVDPASLALALLAGEQRVALHDRHAARIPAPPPGGGQALVL